MCTVWLACKARYELMQPHRSDMHDSPLSPPFHLSVPHYTSMFNRLMLSPQPWRFGSLFLPEGSRNLGSPEFALEPGSKVGPCLPAAPVQGTSLLQCELRCGRVGPAMFWAPHPAAARLRPLAAAPPPPPQAPLAGTLMEVLQARAARRWWDSKKQLAPGQPVAPSPW